jgi:hypothetical protein
MSQLMSMNGGVHTNILGIHDEEKSPLYLPNMNFGPRQRGNQADIGGNKFTALWPQSKLAAGDPTSPLVLLGQDLNDGHGFEPTELGIGGVYRPYFFRGTCKNSVGTALGGAVVQGFLTSGDTFIGETACASDGTYELGTVYFASTHYLVAYYPGSPDIAGTTVNTLVPAL